MPVSAWISEGTGTPGFTSVDHSDTTSKRAISSTPTSVTRSAAGRVPVVSRSTIASGAWSRSMDRYPAYILDKGIGDMDIRISDRPDKDYFFLTCFFAFGVNGAGG